MKSKTTEIKQQIKAYISTLKNATFNYRQVSSAIDATTPSMQRNVAIKLAEIFNVSLDDLINFKQTLIIKIVKSKYFTLKRS